MLKILVIILQFVVFSSTYGQSFPAKNMTYGVWANRFLPDSTLYIPTGCGVPTDSSFLHDKSAQRFHAAKYYDSCGHQEYTWDPSYKFWKVAIPDSVNGFVTHTALNDSLLSKVNLKDSGNKYITPTGLISGIAGKLNKSDSGITYISPYQFWLLNSTVNLHTTEIYSNTVAISALIADSLFQAGQIASLQSGKVTIGGDSHGSSFAIGTNDNFSLGIKTNGHWTYSFGTDGSFGSYNNPFNNDASGNLTAQTLSGLNLTSGMVKAFGNELINAITWTDFVPAIRNGLIRYEKHTEPYGYGFGGQYYDSVRQQGFFAGMNEFEGYSMHFLINWDSTYNYPKITAMNLDSAGNVVFAGKIIGDTLNSQALSGWNSIVKVDSATGNLIPAYAHIDYLTPSDLLAYFSINDTTILNLSARFSLYQPLLTNPVTGLGASGNLAFWNSSNSLSYNTSLFWDNTNNNLGVGTNAPNSSFGRTIHLYNNGSTGTVASNATMIIESSTRNAAMYQWIPSTGGGSWAVQSTGAGSTYGQISFSRNNVGANSTDLSVKTDGSIRFYAYGSTNTGNTQIYALGSTGVIGFYTNGSNNVTISAGGKLLLGTSTDDGVHIFQITGTQKITATTTAVPALTLSGTITASSGIAQGVVYNGTLTAAANGDILSALYINPTFTNGSYTGVGNYALNVNGTTATTTLKINSATTSVGGSISGTAVFTQPQQGAGIKMVMITLTSLLGTASYTFPTAFTNTPVVLSTSGLSASIVTTLTTTGCTVTGVTSSGTLILMGN